MKKDNSVLVVQFLATGGLLWPGRARWQLPRVVLAGGAVLVAVGSAFGFAGGLRHGGRLTANITPPSDALLITDGPYRFSRHPIYAGILLAGAGFAVLRRRPEPLAALAVLVPVLHVKTGLEEARLRERFGPAYDTYAQRTPRLLGLPRVAR